MLKSRVPEKDANDFRQVIANFIVCLIRDGQYKYSLLVHFSSKFSFDFHQDLIISLSMILGCKAEVQAVILSA